MRRIVAVLGSLNSIAALVLCASTARAGADEKIAAEALFDEGRHLMMEGKFGPACEKLEESQRVDAAVGTLLYLAECYEKSGRPASAWATFREASSAARAAGQLERARIGQERATKLEPLLVKLTINVPPEDAAIAGFSVKRSSEAVPQALWGAAVPVDPGDYTVEATAPGYDAFSRRVTIAKDSLAVDVAPLHPAPAASVPPPPPTAAPASTAPLPAPYVRANEPPPQADSGGGLSGGQIAGIVIASAGVVSLAVGTVFGVNAISKNDDAKTHCPRGNVCNDPAGVKLTNDAKDDAVVANITVGLGAAAVVGGGLMYFLMPSKPANRERAFQVVPAVSPHGAFAIAEGRF
jgi:serine/threonine-protein kinase